MELRPGELLDLYYYMVLSRTFEERVSTLYKQGRVQAGVFSGIGQEAICVGTCYGLEDEDFVAPAHRDTGVFLVKGVSPRAIMAQLYGRKTGLSGGKDSALHAGEPELNVFGTTSMLGAQICVTTGAALAFKMRKQPHVAVSYFGEGAAARGDFHEALNFAGVHRLPCIFVCENNHYAYSTPLHLQMACESLADRALGYGFAGKVVDGNDILAVWKTMREALYRARTGAGATLVECMTYRWHGHSEHDVAMYRTEEEFIEWKSRDPIPRFEVYLREKRLLTDETRQQVAEQAKAVVADAVDFAEKSPEPTAEDAATNVFGPSQAAE
ncbi:MAG TPA: thiamine pyrophosphate-dependent dehydrogenase E1 component subunit alpha [Planctomycetota bacterium]|nr:thiamine pyrophosphate-dependent dehydrogenase E1 component subunit alpha [Planctomycetota bacterium]HRR80633.1 thiamine pyrophosphate-dependent dehydrogenase E1 component subunit alpha [Planctomycetota bacterium]HRT97259.1 thiamine pyrophosphate-dependent dehydrogenase E1 component subunit alpha [Planctomycetota bacterium]